MAISLLRSRLVIGLFQTFVSKFRLGGLCSCGCTVITKNTHWAQSNVDFLNLKWRIIQKNFMQGNNWTYIYVTLCESTVQYIVLYSSSVYLISVT